MRSQMHNAVLSGHWELPPLILHPFSHHRETEAVLEAAQRSLQFILAAEGTQSEAEQGKILHARYCEFRMLCFIGKDLMRWVRQCIDFAARDQRLSAQGLREQTFANYLVNSTPPAVAARFQTWAVADYRRILSRAIGLNAVFPDPPEPLTFSAEFLESYHLYADAMFDCYLRLAPFAVLDPSLFSMALFTSDEYMRTVGSIEEEGSG